MSRSNNDMCNVPGCLVAANSRGLCHKHVQRATKGKDPDLRAEARKYADPAYDDEDGPPPDVERPAPLAVSRPTPTTGVDEPLTDQQLADLTDNEAESGPDDAAGVQVASTGRAAAHRKAAAVAHCEEGGVVLKARSREAQIETVIGTVCLFASEMGLGRPTLVEASGQRTWVGPDGKEIILDADGQLHHVTRKVGPAIEL